MMMMITNYKGTDDRLRQRKGRKMIGDEAGFSNYRPNIRSSSGLLL